MTEGWDTGACAMTVGCRLGTVTICVWVGTSGVEDVAAVSGAGGLDAGCRGVTGIGWSGGWFWGGLCWMGMCWVMKEVVVAAVVAGGAGVGIGVGLCLGVTVFSSSGLVG